jgi:dCMP deaminase
MTGTRPSKYDYYLDIAKSVCKRAPCLRRQFGAIIVKNDAIVSTGYNGPARGVVNCSEVGCLKDEVNAPEYAAYEYCTAVHAEENAIINAARHGVSILGGTLFIHGENYKDGSIAESRPCDRCKRAIINAGIKELVIRKQDGSFIKINVSDLVEEDTKNYLKKLEEARKARKK